MPDIATPHRGRRYLRREDVCRAARKRSWWRACRSFPLLVEEARVYNLPGPARPGRRAEIDNGPIGQLRSLQRVVAVAVSAEGNAAVQHDVPLWIERIGKHENRRVIRGGVGLAAKG